MKTNPKVLIVGAGPTGLSAGVELARRGIHATIAERREESSGFSRAVGIIPHTLDLLDKSGVSAHLIEEGIQLTGFNVLDHTKPVLSLPIPIGPDSDGMGTIVLLPQDRTEAHLRDAFQSFGGELRMGLALKNLIQHDDDVTAEFSDGTKQVFDYVLGADGVRSTVRQLADIPYEGFDLPEDWSIADAYLEDWPYPTHFVIFRMDANRVVICAPMAPNRVRFISNTADALALLPVKPNITKLRRSGTFKISIRQAPYYNKGRIYLAGDAAHSHSPVGGRGMNLGIADACEFAQRLSECSLDGYSESRHAQGKTIINGSERARKFIMNPSPLVRFLFISIARLANLFPKTVSKAIRRAILS